MNENDPILIAFELFLKDKKCHAEYLENMKEQREYNSLGDFIIIRSPPPQELVNHAFNWDRSPQKHNYWEGVNDEWKKLIDDGTYKKYLEISGG